MGNLPTTVVDKFITTKTKIIKNYCIRKKLTFEEI